MRNFRWVALLVACGVGCGRTALLTEQDEITVSAGASSRAGTPSGGAQSSAGKGSFGGFSTAGTLGFGGTLGGTFPLPVAGMPNAGGANLGGFPNPDCSLSVGDCRLATELACADTHDVCAGELAEQGEFDAKAVFVNDLAISSSGRLALAGRFRGTLDFGGDSQPLESADSGAKGTDAFVVSIDASGAAQWSFAYSRSAVDDATGVRFTPNGDLVVQGRDATGVFVMRLDVSGNVVWSNWNANAYAEPGRVGIDNDGRIVLGGNYSGSLNLAGAQLSRTGNSGYLVKLSGDGNLLWATDAIPAGWANATTVGLAVDDEDNIVVIGRGIHDFAMPGAFIHKITSKLDFVSTTFLPAELTLRSVAVDRSMRIVVAGTFDHDLSYNGQVHELSSGSGADVWVAQYARSRQSELNWQKAFASGTNGATVHAVAIDPFGNIVLTGNALELDTSIPKPRPEATYALKLRPDGSYVWLQSFAPISQGGALGIDNRGNSWLAGSAYVNPPGMYAFLFQIAQ